MTKRILLALWLLLVAGQACAASTVLVMGDSLSAAYGIEPAQGWVALLAKRLKERRYDYTVVNASVSGETSAGGLTRLPEALAKHKPAVVVLELGANDGLRGTPVNTIQANLGRMIELSKQAGAQVLLVGILLPPNYGPQYTGAFKDLYPQLAKRYQLNLLPFLLDGVAEHREIMQADGLHPKAKGEPAVLDNVWVHLEPLLKSPY
jgi:acyl-CoA thioesterase I